MLEESRFFLKSLSFEAKNDGEDGVTIAATLGVMPYAGPVYDETLILHSTFAELPRISVNTLFNRALDQLENRVKDLSLTFEKANREWAARPRPNST